ncbi:unannotated protein [freshwater metagenome]|uniref:Unannotated protein n=1 Tax=freshwater metagenome TaxID=449393 RepID=A0A6J7FYR4_9ZZZZ
MIERNSWQRDAAVSDRGEDEAGVDRFVLAGGGAAHHIVGVCGQTHALELDAGDPIRAQDSSGGEQVAQRDALSAVDVLG